jgi:hypothetical protein
MKFNSEKKRLSTNVLLVLLALVLAIIVVLVEPFLSRKFHWVKTEKEKYDDTTEVKTTTVADSIELFKGKVTYADFEKNYSAEVWYSNFKSNIVLFNDNYKGKHIDVFGVIKNISTSLVGYSLIALKTGDDTNGDIVCIDVKHEKDGWKDEVKTVAVGDTVHIRGIYSGVSLDPDNLHLISCHLIK